MNADASGIPIILLNILLGGHEFPIGAFCLESALA